jgi:nitrogen regulatory protein PII
MKELNLLLIIAREKDRAAYEKYFSRHALASYTTLPCHGTAQNRVLDLLGIEQTEKTILLSVIGKQQTKDILDTLPDQMEIDLPGRGIGLVIPVNSMGGVRSMQALTGSTEAEEREVVKMEYNAHLIIAILNKGFSDVAMEAARAAGAGGGTVVRAKGTYGKGDEHFFGMTLAEEKDTVLIVATEAQRKPIMQALMHQASEKPELGTVTFSVPVSDTMGLRLDRNFNPQK